MFLVGVQKLQHYYNGVLQQSLFFAFDKKNIGNIQGKWYYPKQ